MPANRRAVESFIAARLRKISGSTLGYVVTKGVKVPLLVIVPMHCKFTLLEDWNASKLEVKMRWSKPRSELLPIVHI